MLGPSLETGGQDKTEDVDSDDVHLTAGTAEVGDEDQATLANVAGGALTIDPNVQYQLRADTSSGQVTYRVVQVSQNDDGQSQVLNANTFPHGTPVAQAVIQSPFANGADSPTTDSLQTETRFAYVPTAVSAAGDSGNTNPEVAVTAASLGQIAAGPEGQFYVMMSPQDVLQGQRSIAPRTGVAPRLMEQTRSTRDDRRRATHNEVERRRRDKINSWIVQLSKLVPDCALDHAKTSQVSKLRSKLYFLYLKQQY